MLERVHRTGETESAVGSQYAGKAHDAVFWPYAIWAGLGEVSRPSGVMVLITKTTQTALAP